MKTNICVGLTSEEIEKLAVLNEYTNISKSKLLGRAILELYNNINPPKDWVPGQSDAFSRILTK